MKPVRYVENMRELIRITMLALLAVIWRPVESFGAEAPPNANETAAFLTDYQKKAGVIVRSDGLEYRVLRSGFGKRLGLTDVAEINYTGRLINGTVFDGTSAGLPASFTVNGVIQGLSEALPLMHEGDRWEIVVPPNLAFGVRGASNGSVPPNQTLVFDLTLISTSTTLRAAQIHPVRYR